MTKKEAKPFSIKKRDVSIRPMAPLVCEDCDADATHGVHLFLANNGEEVFVGNYCERDAKHRARALKQSLPR